MTGAEPRAGAQDATDEADADDAPGAREFAPLRWLRSAIFGAPPAVDPEQDENQSSGPEEQAQQRQLVANVRRLGGMRVSDAMVPRADVVAVEVDADFETVVGAFRSEGHSRLPVFQETLDDTIGFIHVKDVFLASVAATDDADDSFAIRRHLRRVLTVPPSMPCGVLLQKMQAERVHMALVIDEYGGVDGLVSIEDLLELIVGDIEDEHDPAAAVEWTREDDRVYRADARAYLEDFEAATGVSLVEPGKVDEIDTLGGLVFMLCNRVPARGEVVQHPDGHEFEILDADPRRIKRLLITLATPDRGAETPSEAAKGADIIDIQAAQ